MFGFSPSKRKHQVRNLLVAIRNRTYSRQFRYGYREDARGLFSEVVWVVPVDTRTGEPDPSGVCSAITRDASAEGLSLIQTAPLAGPPGQRVLVGLLGDGDPKFLSCTMEHSTPLGYGFYQIGLHADEVVAVSPYEIEEMRQVMDEFQEQHTAQHAAASAS